MATSEKVELKGASAYKKDLQNIAQESRTLAAEMRSLAAGFDESTSAEQRDEAIKEKLNQQIDAQQRYIDKLREAIEAETQKSGENSTATMRLREQLANAETTMSQLQGTTEQTADSEDHAAQSAASFGDVLKANVLADFIVSGIKALADAIKDVANSIKDCYTDSVTWADDLATLATKTGISTDALQEMEYMAGLVDTDVETITGSMTKLTRNMNTARDGTGAAAEAFEKLGITITEEDGSLRDNGAVFDEIIGKLAEMPEGAERDAIAMELMGKSAQDLNPLIAAGAETLEALRQEAHETGYVMDEEMIGSLLESADAADRMKARTDGLKRQLSARLAPTISDLQDKLLGLFDGVDWDAVGAKIDDIVNGFINFCTWVRDNKDTILALFAGIAAGFAAFQIGTLIMEVIGFMKQFATVQAAVNAILAANPLMLIATAIAAVVAGVILLIQNWETVKEVAERVWTSIKEGVANAWQTIVEKMAAIGQSIKDKFVEIKSQIGGWIQDHLVQPIRDKISEFRTVGTQLLEGLWNGISDKVAWLKQQVRGVVDKIKSWFTGSDGFDTHSPSKWARGIGEYVTEGLAIGMEDNSGLVQGAFDNVMPTVGTLGAASAGAGAVGGSVINVYPQSLDNAQIDYLYTRFNAQMGVMA